MLSKMQKLLALPTVLGEFMRPVVGAEYGVNARDKLKLLRQMRDNTTCITTASDIYEHIALAIAALSVPSDVEGSIVECGTFKGSSAATLSLLAALCRRKLDIFDSFEGLPEPGDRDRSHKVVAMKQEHTYEKGAFAGSIAEVEENLSRYGVLDVCRLHKGYFDQTLPDFSDPVVLVFTDVDLVDSLEPCIRYLWPLLQDGCSFYTHEASHMEIAGMFFDRVWWNEVLGEEPPGMIGSGSGLGLGPIQAPYLGSQLGYTVKNSDRIQYTTVPQVG